MLRLLKTNEEKSEAPETMEGTGRRRSSRARAKVSYSEKQADKDFRERLRASNAAAKEAKKKKSVRARSAKKKGKSKESSDDNESDEDSDEDEENDNGEDSKVFRQPTRRSSRVTKKVKYAESSSSSSEDSSEEDEDSSSDEDDDSDEESSDESDEDEEEPVVPSKILFNIEKVISHDTRTMAEWEKVCGTMNTSEIQNGRRGLNIQNENQDIFRTFERRFLIKWSDLSYLHVSWETEEDLKFGAKYAAQKIKKYLGKDNSMETELYGERRFDPSYVSIHRILDESELPDGQKQVFVKWSKLHYDALTWEKSCDLDPQELKQALDEYYRLNELPNCGSLLEVEKALYKPGRPSKDIRSEKTYDSVSCQKKSLSLRSYQIEGLNWMIWNWQNNRNSILADEMGLGKTCQSACFLQHLWKNEPVGKKNLREVGQFLVVAPLSTLEHWQREIETWTELHSVIYHGSEVARQTIVDTDIFYSNGNKMVLKTDVIITSFEMVMKDASFFQSVRWRSLVVDEAHRLKNHKTKLSQQIRRRIHWDSCLLLTGTPIQNSTDELWSLLSLLDVEEFGGGKQLGARGLVNETRQDAADERSLLNFQRKFGGEKDTQTGGTIHESDAIKTLHNVIGPYMLRRLKGDVEANTLPSKEETIIEVELTPLQKQIYRALYEKNAAYLLRKGAGKASLNNLSMQLRKCCNHPFLIRGVADKYASDDFVDCCGKMVLLDKLLPKLISNGHKILIFSQMIKVLDILADYMDMRGMAFERIDGSVRGRDRQISIDRFTNKDSKAKVFLLCTRAGGVGINLMAADRVIIFDSDWNPQNDIQAMARAHRIGQTKDVKIYRLITSKTYEHQMFLRASLKLGLDQAILTGAEGKDMTKNELENLLRHGAYDLFRENDKESSKKSAQYNSENIEDILERSKVVTYDATNGTENHFSKATFVAGTSEDNEVDIDDPDFWSKTIGLQMPTNSPIKLDRASRSARMKRVSYNPKDFYGKDVADAFEDAEEDGDEEYDNDYDGIITKNLRQRILKGLREFGLGCTEAFQQSVNKKRGNLSNDVIDEVCISYIALLSQVFVRTSRSLEAERISNNQQNSDENSNDSSSTNIDVGDAKTENSPENSSVGALHVTRLQALKETSKAYAIAGKALEMIEKNELVGDTDLDFIPHDCVGQDRSFVGQLFNSPATCQSQLKLIDDCTMLYKLSVNTDDDVTKKVENVLEQWSGMKPIHTDPKYKWWSLEHDMALLSGLKKFGMIRNGVVEKIKKDESNIFCAIIQNKELPIPPTSNFSKRANGIIQILMKVFPEYACLQRPEVTEAKRKREERERELARKKQATLERREQAKEEKRAQREKLALERKAAREEKKKAHLAEVEKRKMERKLAMENAKKERAREKQLKAEKKKLELAKKWTKADKRNFKEALYALGFPESLNTVSEVDNQNESAEASKDNKVTLANLCSKPDQTLNESSEQFYPFLHNDIDGFIKFASLVGKERKSVLDRLKLFEDIISGKGPRNTNEGVNSEDNAKKNADSMSDNKLLSAKAKKRLKGCIDLFKKFRRRVLAREVDVVKEALQLYLKGSLKFRTLSKGLNVPSDWFCKDDDSTYLDWILLQSIGRYGLNTRAFDIVRGVYKKDTSKNSDKAEDAEMEDFEENAVGETKKDVLSDKVLKARFELIVAYIARHNARGMISADSFTSVEKGSVGESATSRMAKRQQASLGMFIPGLEDILKVDGKKKRSKTKKKVSSRAKEKHSFSKGKAPVEFEEPIAVALSTNQEITHKTAQEVGALILGRTEMPFDASSNLKVISFGKIHVKEGLGPLHSKSYIYPIGYKAEKSFRSFKDPDKRVVYTQEILLPEEGSGAEGDVLFKLTAADAPDEPIVSDSSATRVWRIVLEKLKKKRKELNMPPSKQLISGPKFFGLSNVQVQLRLEGLEGAEKCEKYRFLIQKSYSARLNEQRKTADENTSIAPGTLQDTGDGKGDKTLNDTESATTKCLEGESEFTTDSTNVVKDASASLGAISNGEIPFNSIGNKRVRPLLAANIHMSNKKIRSDINPDKATESKNSPLLKKKRPIPGNDGKGSAIKKAKKITSFFFSKKTL